MIKQEKDLVYPNKKEFCNYKNYEIYKIYKDAEISSKNDKRPAYQEMMNGVKNDSINVVVALKLDRITRSVYDVEKLMRVLNKYGCDLDCRDDDLNTVSSNGKIYIRITTALVKIKLEDVQKEQSLVWSEQLRLVISQIKLLLVLKEIIKS